MSTMKRAGTLATICTTKHAAEIIGVSPARVRQYVAAGRLSARKATPAEVVALLEAGWIAGVPPTGVNVLERDEVETFEPKPTGRPRERDDT